LKIEPYFLFSPLSLPKIALHSANRNWTFFMCIISSKTPVSCLENEKSLKYYIHSTWLLIEAIFNQTTLGMSKFNHKFVSK
jgi:hypothetical protein